MHKLTIAFGAAMLVGASIAHAGVSDDFAACDGRIKPKSKDDGMRGVATEKIIGFSLQGMPSGGRGGPAATIAACDKVLAGDYLQPTQTLRRAHLLRARAAAYVEQSEPAKAIADLDAAEAAIADRRGEVFFDRSMGASLDLLRAMALVQLDRSAEAQALADKAVALRPYALQVQMAAAMVRDAARTPATGGSNPWDGLLSIAPEFAPALIAREVDMGNFASAVRIGEHAPLRLTPRPAATKDISPASLMQSVSVKLSTLNGALDLAYAHAATGQLAKAREHLELARAGFALASETTAPVSLTATGTAGTGLMEQLLAPKIALVEARIAVAEGNMGEARRKAMGKLPSSAATVNLFHAIAAADDGAPPKGLAAIEAEIATKRSPATKMMGQLADTVLIAPESSRSVIDYEKSRPDFLRALVGAAVSMGTTLLSGIEKTAGFKETVNADGTITVDYLGSTPAAAMVQEMTLLRAAELTRQAGKPAFAIEARKDFTRYLTQTMYGSPINRTPTGHKTELTIRMLADPAGHEGLTITAGEVIGRLGPLYYEGKPREAASRTASR